MATRSKQELNRRRWIVENVTSLAIALAIVFAIRSSIIEAFRIPSGSMIPTLLIGDHIFVNKFSYGFKVPFTDLLMSEPMYVFKREPPKRGDIIVFKYPKDESVFYIKRVIGTPGDTVEIRNKALYLNGQPVPRDLVEGAQAEKVFNKIDDPKYRPSNDELYTEKLDHADHPILLDRSNFAGESFPPVTVPPDNLFVMGDNRDFSNDSRFWGFVPYRNVKGRAVVIWLSLWISFSDSQFIFRPDRIGTILK